MPAPRVEPPGAAVSHMMHGFMWSWLRRRGEWLWAPGLYALVVLVLYREVWWGDGGELRWFGWDCLEYYWPDLSYYAGSVRAGEFPQWNPYDRGGYAFYADTHPGLYYPVTWIFVAAGAAAGAMPAWAIQAKALLHLMIAGTCMHAYARSRHLHPAAAALAGVAWVVSVPMIVHKASALEWPLVWGPLVLLCLDRAIEGARSPGWWRRAAALAASMWLASSAGPPYGFFYILIVAIPYGAMRLGQELRAGGRTRALFGCAAHGRTLGVATVLTLALLAVMVIPAMSALQLSGRAKRSPNYPYHTALPPGPTLKGLVAPRAGRVDPYMGVLVLGLAIAGVAARPRNDRWAPVFFCAAAAGALTLTFGRASPVLPFLVDHVPGFGLFREPNRYKCLAAMALAIAAGHGLDGLIRAGPGDRKRLAITLVATLAALAVIAAVLKTGPPPERGILVRASAGWWLTFGALGLGCVLCLGAVFRDGRARVAAAAAVVGVVYFDLASFGHWYVTVPTEPPVDDQEDRRFLDGLDGAGSEWRIWDEFVMQQRPGSRLRVRNLRGYPSGAPFGDVRYETLRKQLGRHPELLEVFNVRWVLHGGHRRSGTHSNNIKRPPSTIAPKHFRRVDARRFEALHPVPLVAWYGGVSRVDGPAQALAALRTGEGDGGVRVRAVVEAADVPGAAAADIEALAAAADPPPLLAGELVSFSADRVEVDIDAPAAGIVVVNEKMFPGWQVTVDGAPATGFRANYLLRGVLVEAGSHRVVWEFRPPGLGILLGMFLASLGFLLVAAGVAVRRR